MLSSLPCHFIFFQLPPLSLLSYQRAVFFITSQATVDYFFLYNTLCSFSIRGPQSPSSSNISGSFRSCCSSPWFVGVEGTDVFPSPGPMATVIISRLNHCKRFLISSSQIFLNHKWDHVTICTKYFNGSPWHLDSSFDLSGVHPWSKQLYPGGKTDTVTLLWLRPQAQF